MAEYTRKYPDAPTPEEIKQGYAPSTVRRTPFVKFGFWTFVGLAVSYAIGWGTYKGLDALEDRQVHSAYRRSAARAPEPFTGLRLQPSPGHDTLDWQDMEALSTDYAKGLRAKKLWAGTASPYRSGFAGKAQISDQAVGQTAAAIQQWVAASAAAITRPAGEQTGARANDQGNRPHSTRSRRRTVEGTNGRTG